MTDVALFAGLPPTALTQVLQAGRPRDYARGEVILRWGDPAACLHLLRAGRADVCIPTEAGDEMIVTVLGPGAVVGEQAALPEESEWTVTVVAREACQTLSFRRSQILDVLRHHPAVATQLMASTQAQFRQVCDRLAEMAYVSTSRRVQRRLLHLRATYADDVIAVTQSDLASMAGATRTTVNSILSDLERRGIVRKGRGQLEILDLDALSRGSRSSRRRE